MSKILVFFKRLSHNPHIFIMFITLEIAKVLSFGSVSRLVTRVNKRSCHFSQEQKLNEHFGQASGRNVRFAPGGDAARVVES